MKLPCSASGSIWRSEEKISTAPKQRISTTPPTRQTVQCARPLSVFAAALSGKTSLDRIRDERYVDHRDH